MYIKEKMETPFTPKNAIKYGCNLCHFKCYKLSDWVRHTMTLKHKKIVNGNEMEQNGNPCDAKYICECKKEYISASGLWKHKKKCNYNNLTENDIEDDNKILSLVMEVVKQNNDFKNIIIEQNNKMLETVQEVCKNGITNNSNNTNIVNSHNKAFKLKVFLNETCKDAMDINEFEDSIKLQLSDLELVGRLGFVDGISSIIIKNLKSLKVHERPVHCTDLKRETMYVNDKGVWEKQENDNKKLRRLIKHIAFKNAKNLSLYKELHPDYNDYYSKCSDHFLKLQIEAFGGSGNETVDNENKIIKKIVKEMGIDKRL